MTPMPVSAPFILARELGSFEKAGLKVELKEYSLGKLALEDLSKGDIDLACAAVTPLVHRRFADGDFLILCSLASSTGMVALVARKDAGITNLVDLAGKRIGISKGTSGEFFFETMRVLHRVPRSNIAPQDRPVDQLVAGLKDGSLDAVSIWEPQLTELQNDMPEKLQLFYGQGLYTFTWNLVALPKTIETRRDDLEKLLRVLIDTGRFIENNPDEARAVLQKLQGGPRIMGSHLSEVNFRPCLKQDLLVQLEAEARWIISRDSKTNSLPNFLRSIDSSILKAVSPQAVDLIQ